MLLPGEGASSSDDALFSIHNSVYLIGGYKQERHAADIGHRR